MHRVTRDDMPSWVRNKPWCRYVWQHHPEWRAQAEHVDAGEARRALNLRARTLYATHLRERDHAPGGFAELVKPTRLEGPDEWIPLSRAADLAGLGLSSIRRQVQRGKLRTTTMSGNWDRFTTRRWLHEYLMSRDSSRGGKAAPLPADYQDPTQE